MKKRPGRPRKKPDERRTVDLRIPVTPKEKRRIQQALDGRELAGWVRDVVFAALEEQENKRER